MVANQATPILQCHGDSDPLLHPSFGKLTADKLHEINSQHEYKIYEDMGHSSCDEVIYIYYLILCKLKKNHVYIHIIFLYVYCALTNMFMKRNVMKFSQLIGYDKEQVRPKLEI